MRVTAQLVQVDDQSQVWAETYERDLRDVLILQSEVAEAVARAIAVTLTPDAQARLARARPVRAGGLPGLPEGTLTSGTEGPRRPSSRRSGISKRPSPPIPAMRPPTAVSRIATRRWALHRSSAGCLLGRPCRKRRPLPSRRCRSTARWRKRTPPSPWFIFFTTGIWRLLRRNSGAPSSWIPNYTAAHHWYSHCLLPLGRTEESLAESKRALELEPLQLVVGIHLGWHYLYARQYDQAIEQFRKTLELDPAFPQAQRYAAWAYLQKGMHPEAIAALRAALSALGRDPEIEGELGHALRSGRPARRGSGHARGLGPSLATRYVSPYSVALVHAGLGDRDQALAWLDKAYAERSDYMPYLRLEPMLDGLRSDHRFAALVRRVGLPTR